MSKTHKKKKKTKNWKYNNKCYFKIVKKIVFGNLNKAEVKYKY